MDARSPMERNTDGRRVLFVQAAEPAAYPPLIHASGILADQGWQVTFVAAPLASLTVKLNVHPRINCHRVRVRNSHVMKLSDYFCYIATAIRIATRLRPQVIYSSNLLGAAPGLLAAKFTSARFVYHEHDSPNPASLNPIHDQIRAAALRRADLVIFPNEERAKVAQAEYGLSTERFRIVWNMPRRAELPHLKPSNDSPLLIHYHGNISPQLLPETVVEVVRRLSGLVRLRIAGYEAPGAQGYLSYLKERGGGLVEYLGQISRSGLLLEAAKAHVGLALLSEDPNNINMQYLLGASNKVFDYMGAGLVPLISDRPDWRALLADQGYAIACSPLSADSIEAALKWLIEHASERMQMGCRGRLKIENDWNYETAFAPIVSAAFDNDIGLRVPSRPLP